MKKVREYYINNFCVVKFRDVSDVYNAETGDLYQVSDCSSTQDLVKNLSIGQKEYLLNAIKLIVEKSEENEQMVERFLDKDPELCNALLKMQDEVIESYKVNHASG